MAARRQPRHGRSAISTRCAGRKASCDEATYVNSKQRVYCRGNAEMQQGSDRVRGKEIELHLDTQQLFVRGGAEVRITPKQKAGGGGA